MQQKNRRLAQEEDEMRRIWKEYFKDLYNVDTQEQVAVYMCSFDGVRKGNYIGGEPVGRADFEVSSRMESPQLRMRSLDKL